MAAKCCEVCGARLTYNGKFYVCKNWKSHKDSKARSVKPPNKKALAIAPPKPKPDYFTFRLSTQQQALVDTVLRTVRAYERGDTSIALVRGVARAGTGKTTTAMATIAYIRREFPDLYIGYAAFNRNAADHAIDIAPHGTIANTIHSLLGLNAIRAAYGKQVKVDGKKYWAIVDELLPEEKGLDDDDRKMIRGMKIMLMKMADLCLNYLSYGDDRQTVIDMAATHGHDILSYGEPFFENLSKLVRRGLDTAHISVNFSEMLAVPIMCAGVHKFVKTFDVLFVDELQDLTRAQQALAMLGVDHVPADIHEEFGIPYRTGTQPGLLVGIGDDRQAIYAFRGALSNGMDNFVLLATDTGRTYIDCPINQTRRCPKQIVDLARYIVPDFEALDDAPDGEALVIDDFYLFVHVEQGRRDTLVLARTNAALATVALKFVKRGIPVEFVSKDLGTELMSMTRRFLYSFKKQFDRVPTTKEYCAELNRRIMILMQSAKGKRQKAKQALELDKLEVMLVLAGDADEWEKYFQTIAILFGSDLDPEMHARAVRFSTIHSIKGDEDDYVIIVGGDLMPHPMAETEVEIMQEENLLYVALTRAKWGLMFLTHVPYALRNATIESVC